MTWIVAAALGAMGWSFAEYILHRFDGHGMKGKTKFSREHLAHHANPMYFAPNIYKAGTAVAVVVPMGSVGWFAFGGPGVLFAVCFTLTYLAYEVLHRRIHTHPPTNRYSAWARQHHLHHHFNGPSLNHGVTSLVWDWVFGTLAPVEVVRVPRRHAPDWMVDSEGQLLPRFENSYVLKGRPAKRKKPAALIAACSC